MNYLKGSNVKDKTVVLRADFDVPISHEGKITSDFRIKAVIPTIKYLKNQGAKAIILVGHLGRPVMRPRESIENIARGNPLLTMEPVAKHLRSLLHLADTRLSTKYFEGCRIPAYILTRGLYLLENIRFDARETENNSQLTEELKSLGDLYVYDAFAVGHRDQISTAGVLRAMPSVGGLQLQQEVTELTKLTADIAHPYIMVLGGAKIETKMPIIERLLNDVDLFLLGGIMANTFLKAQGMDVKQSIVEPEMIELANDLYKRAPKKFIIPSDYVWQNDKILDIGLKTRQQFKTFIADAEMIFWNGTLGLTSTTAQEFKFGSLDIAQAIAHNKKALTIISGGDTVGLLEEEQIDLTQYSFVSTGGGATLEFLSGNKLPALDALGYYEDQL